MLGCWEIIPGQTWECRTVTVTHRLRPLHQGDCTSTQPPPQRGCAEPREAGNRVLPTFPEGQGIRVPHESTKLHPLGLEFKDLNLTATPILETFLGVRVLSAWLCRPPKLCDIPRQVNRAPQSLNRWGSCHICPESEMLIYSGVC